MKQIARQVTNSASVLLAALVICVQSGPAETTVLQSHTARSSGPELGVPYNAYTLRLESFAPVPNRVLGLLLKTRINGGPTLRLLLDTGAENITIDSRSASRSGLVTISDSLLVGAGDSPTKASRRGLAETVATGDLLFKQCRVDVVPGKVVAGADGVIPMSLFADFLLRLDLPRRTLDLRP